MTDRAAPVSRSSAPHHTWARVCAGWRLTDNPGRSVVEENSARRWEVRHYHNEARQFFYVPSGAATVETEGRKHEIRAGSGLEVAPA